MVTVVFLASACGRATNGQRMSLNGPHGQSTGAENGLRKPSARGGKTGTRGAEAPVCADSARNLVPGDTLAVELHPKISNELRGGRAPVNLCLQAEFPLSAGSQVFGLPKPCGTLKVADVKAEFTAAPDKKKVLVLELEPLRPGARAKTTHTLLNDSNKAVGILRAEIIPCRSKANPANIIRQVKTQIEGLCIGENAANCSADMKKFLSNP